MLPLKAAISSVSLFALMASAPSYETGTLRGRGAASKTTARTSNPGALAGFRLEFIDGDHKVKNLGVTHSHRNVRAAMADNDGNDRFSGRAWYRSIGMRTHQTEANCAKGRCTIRIQRPRHGEEFVLRGFMFERIGGDQNIEEIAVEPRPERGDVVIKFADRKTRSDRDVRVKLEYGYIPGSAVSGSFLQRHSRRRGEQKLELNRRVRGAAVLQSFSFRFTNGDHHLKQFAIEQYDRQFQLMFNDNNTDDGYDAQIRYAVLR